MQVTSTIFHVEMCLQFQEQLGQGCSPEESDTFQAQGWCHTAVFHLPSRARLSRATLIPAVPPEGSEILDQMLQCLEHLPKPMPQLEVPSATPPRETSMRAVRV